MSTKRLFYVAGATVALAAAGCGLVEPDDGCSNVRNTLSTLRGDTVTTNTGLRYIDVTVGTGRTVQTCKAVAVRYVGTLLSGAPVDSGSFAFTPGFGDVIDGFEQGVIGMRVGGRRRLIIPPDLGYGAAPQVGANGQVVVPAKSTLIFVIDALDAAQ